jgi:hypothetical protein
MPVTSGKTTTQSNSSSRTTSGSRETGNYNRLAASLNGTPPNATRGQSSSNSGSGLGLTVSKTMPGNTAYGPAGGMATSYGTRAPSSGNSRAAGQNVGPASSMAQSAQKSAKQYISPNATTVMAAPPSGPNYKKVPLADVAKRIATASKQFGKQFGKKPVKPGISDDMLPGSHLKPPTRSVTPLPITSVRPGGKANGPLGAGWQDRVPSGKAAGPLGSGWQERVPGGLPPPTGESYIKTK